MDAKPLNLVRPEVPVELAALVAKMMAKEPERRFQTPGEVAQALPFFKAVRTRCPDRAPRTPAREGDPSRPPKAVVLAPSQRRPSARPRPPRQVLRRSRAQSPWVESLIEFKETERSTAAVKPKPEVAPSSAPMRRPPWVWTSIATGVLLFGLVVVGWQVFSG